MALNYGPSSQYINTEVTNQYITYLDGWEYIAIPKSASDSPYVIPPKFDKRPDLLANELYSNPRLWWIFSVRNQDLLKDPIEDFVAGITITIPARATIEKLF